MTFRFFPDRRVVAGSERAPESTDELVQTETVVENRLPDRSRDLVSSDQADPLFLFPLEEAVDSGLYPAAPRAATTVPAPRQPPLDNGSDEATQPTESPAALQARAITAIDNGAPAPVEGAKAIDYREGRFAEVAVDLDLRLKHSEEEQRRIRQVLADATRAADVLTALDARLTTMTGSGQSMERAAKTVECLEQRAAEAAGHFDQLARVRIELEHDLLQLQQQLKTMVKSARQASDPSVSDPSVNGTSASDAGRADPVSQSMPELSANHSIRRRTDRIALRRRWAVRVAVLAVCALGGTAAIWGSGPRVGVAARAILAQVVPAASPPLPSHAVQVATLLLLVRAPQRDVLASRDTVFDTGSRTSRVLSAASEGLPSHTSGSTGFAASPGIIAFSRIRSEAARPADEFSGTLSVDSVPSGAAVYINQRRVGETPLRFQRMRAGSHVIWVEREGYERWSTSALVPDGEYIRVNAKLLRKH